MKIRKSMLTGILLLVGGTAFAQEYPKWEIPVDFSYVRGNPSRFGNSRSLNGGGGSIVYNFNQWFGIKGDLQGYGSTTTTIVIPVMPGSAGGTFAAQGNLFTYMAGPQIRVPAHTFKPFGELLFGGAHSNLYSNLSRLATGVTTSSNPNNNAFAMAVGIGVDVRLSKNIYLRPVNVDYLLTHFGNNLFGLPGTNQNNFRYEAGVVFAFGE